MPTQNTDGVGEDFASDLSGYGDLLNHLPDTIVQGILFSDPFAQFTRSFADWFLPLCVLGMLGFALIKSFADKAKMIANVLLAASIAYVLLFPVRSVHLADSKDRVITANNHAMGAVYPLKAGVGTLLAFQSGLNRFLEEFRGGLTTKQVYDFLHQRHLDSINDEQANALKQALTLFHQECTKIAIPAAKAQNNKVSARDFQTLGLLGGSTIGDGYSFKRPNDPNSPYDEYDLAEINDHYLGFSANASHVNWGTVEQYESRARATKWLYENGRYASHWSYEIPVYSHKFWRQVYNDKHNVTGNPLHPSTASDSDIVPATDNPFSAYVTRPKVDDPIVSSSDVFESAENSSTAGVNYIVKDCWSAYVTAEAAMTYFMDAQFDNANGANDGMFDTYPRSELRKRALGQQRSVTIQMSTFTVRDAQTKIMNSLESEGGLYSELANGLKSAAFTVTASFKEEFKIFTVMGLFSLLLVTLLALYVGAPLFFCFSPLVGPDLIYTWLKLILVIFIAVIFAMLIVNLGALLLFQVMLSHYQGDDGYLGAPDITSNLLFTSVYMATLAALGAVEIAAAYIIVFKDGGAFRKASGDTAGLTNSVASLAVAGAAMLASRLPGLGGMFGGGSNTPAPAPTSGSQPVAATGIQHLPNAGSGLGGSGVGGTQTGAQWSGPTRGGMPAAGPQVELSGAQGTFLPGSKTNGGLPPPKPRLKLLD